MAFSSGENFSYLPLFPLVAPFFNSAMAITLLFATSKVDYGMSRNSGPSEDGSTFLAYNTSEATYQHLSQVLSNPERLSRPAQLDYMCQLLVEMKNTSVSKFL